MAQCFPRAPCFSANTSGFILHLSLSPDHNAVCWQLHRQSRGFKLVHCSTTSRCTKSPVSPSSVISAQPADKWAVNRINSGHMYSPVFNYLAVNLAKEVRVTAQHSSSSLPLCFSAAPCFSALTSLPHCSSSQTLGPTVHRSNHICIRTRW